MPLFWRALLAFLALPFVVAGVIPWAFLRPGAPRVLPNGVPFMVLGLGLLLWCVKEFYAAGKGTLAPWDPPRRLVTSGPYRYTRNPMYVAVLLILSGWALTLDFMDVRAPLHYAVLVAVLFHLRVIFFEERWAARSFGDEWQRYRTTVPRWLFRDRPFLTLILVVTVVGLLGAEPPGYDYDPHPVREPLRNVAIILGLPALLPAFALVEVFGESRLLAPIAFGLGLLPYIGADAVYRRWRARRARRAASGPRVALTR